MSIDFKALAAPFSSEIVQHKVGRAGLKSNGEPWAILHAHINARAVQNRLDSVVGPDKWSTEYVPVSDGFICKLSIEIEPGKWITKSDGAQRTEYEEFKGGLSKALVRAASTWGIGRYLYDLPVLFARFIPHGTDGAERVEINGNTYYWIAPSISPAGDVFNSESPRSSLGPKKSYLPKAATGKSKDLGGREFNGETEDVPACAPRAKIISRSQPGKITLDEKPGDYVVKFGLTQGRRLSELDDHELDGLVSFISKLSDPKGKAKELKKYLDLYVSSSQAV
jgi:hypothetical protein